MVTTTGREHATMQQGMQQASHTGDHAACVSNADDTNMQEQRA